MGEIADATINGDFCQSCGEFLGEGDGFPRNCEACGGVTDFAEMKEASKRYRQNNRQRAESDFRDASRLASSNGLKLIRHTDVHYKLVHQDWALEVYPGNRRIYRQKGNAPYLKLPFEWTLLEVVKAAIGKDNAHA